MTTATYHNRLRWGITTDRKVAQRALRVAGAVGTLLVAIDYGYAILAGAMTTLAIVKCALAYGVPYSVSTHSSILAPRPQE